MDRRVVVSALAALGAVLAGVGAVVVGAGQLSIVAVLAGVIAAAGIASFGIAHRDCRVRLRAADVEQQRLRREVSTLHASLAEHATMRTAREHLDQPGGDGPAAGDSPAGGDGPPMPPAPDDAIDPVSGLLDERFFPVLVYQRVAAARRLLQPVSIVMFEIDSMRDAPQSVRDEGLGVLGDVLRSALRECDTSCRMRSHGAGAVLENTTEAGAVWAVERVRGILLASPVGVNLTISAAVACYPSHALAADELLERADRALAVARSRGSDHVEVARLD
ncbi:MAG: diguanylate cyclase [Acidimicrobiia bacterium]